MKPSEETKTVLEGLRSELYASMALFGREKPEVASWNAALEKAVRFVDKYMEGKGLFQIGESEKDEK